MLASSVFNQNDGEVTKAYYATMNGKGYQGMLAVALFRAQKRSTAAKKYRGRQYKNAAYDVKKWSIDQVCGVLLSWLGFESITWGWGRDHKAPGFTWVLYVDLPTGQCSFHSRERGKGPAYNGHWRPGAGSESNILEFCDSVWDPSYAPKLEDERAVEEARKGKTQPKASEQTGLLVPYPDEPQSWDQACREASGYPNY